MEPSSPTTNLPITPPSGTTVHHPNHHHNHQPNPVPLPRGVYVPMPAFFQPSTPTSLPDDTIDIPATQRHTARLLAAGVSGLVVHGSNGEAVHLSRRERRAAIEAVADTVRHETDSHAPVPILAGCSAQSVRETLELCREAREAGATHALDRGVKLTCGNTGKLARVVEGALRVRAGRDDFFVGGGSADFILQGLVVGAHGTISGFANLAPRACVRIGELFEEGRLKEARALQHEVAKGDWLAIRYGFIGVKAAMPYFHGESEDSCAVPRLPFKRLDQNGQGVREIREGMAGVLEIERRLAAEAVGGK
ncbi:hypothetical protein NEMBOFW57_002782 [Staphylotrichum longicolle]|uniref:Uncharacterized protein n=1 Tax=Staphylotrichum longicolle TaxID=669026 RepID=A0AAD4I229_9PEZI|nr:hypothetical protein NEMBOFW57_002782 [Staphylotrichum longicolle]